MPGQFSHAWQCKAPNMWTPFKEATSEDHHPSKGFAQLEMVVSMMVAGSQLVPSLSENNCRLNEA
jgi:hypothetical protein